MQKHTETFAPGRSFICDLNGKIEYVVSKRVARSSSEIKLRCEPISIVSERIEGVACEKMKNNLITTLIKSSFRRKRGHLSKIQQQTWAIGDIKGVVLRRISTADPIKKF